MVSPCEPGPAEAGSRAVDGAWRWSMMVALEESMAGCPPGSCDGAPDWIGNVADSTTTREEGGPETFASLLALGGKEACPARVWSTESAAAGPVGGAAGAGAGGRDADRGRVESG